MPISPTAASVACKRSTLQYTARRTFHVHKSVFHDSMSRYSTVAIYGVGLIGGSIGLALRGRRLAGEVVGVGRREESLSRARERGAVDRTTTDLANGVANAEVIVVCTPVGMIAEHVQAVAAVCPADALITDAGSTKAEIVAAINTTSGRCKPAGAAFVGSHPLAGDHRTSVDHARADLFKGRTVVVTPTDDTPKGIAERASAFWKAIGANVHLMTPSEHDKIIATASHAPHLIAAAIAAATPNKAMPFVASGWLDATRIAGGDPDMWQAIVAANRQPILDALAGVETEISEFRKAIEAGDDDRLVQLLTQAKRMRDALGS